jgi:hypothetical protein
MTASGEFHQRPCHGMDQMMQTHRQLKEKAPDRVSGPGLSFENFCLYCGSQ